MFRMKSCLNKEPNDNDLRIKEIYKGFDITDSDFKEYKDAIYKLLKFQNYRVRALNGQFVCPFCVCVGEGEQGYYGLLAHAVRISESSLGSAKNRADHSAMAKYLVIDLKDESHQAAKDQSKKDLELNSRKEELDKREVALTEEKKKMDDLMREKNDEILEAEKQLMKGLENMPSHCRVKFGVKKRGEIDEKAIMDACKKKHLLNETETKAFELCCFWVKKWRDSKRLLTEKDILKRCTKDYWGNKIYNAVLEYIANGNGMELWNFEEDSKASHCEVVGYVCTQWKKLQCKRDELTEAFHSTPHSRTMSMSYSEEDESDEESSEDEGCPDPKADKWNAKKDLVKPKPPPSAFIVFMENFLKTYNQIDPTHESLAVIGKAGGDKWISMSQTERAPYQAIAEKRKQEYEKLMIAYNKKQDQAIAEKREQESEKLMIAYNKKQDSSSDEGSESLSDSDLEEDDTCSSEA